MHFNALHQRTEMMHQQRMSCYGLRIIEHTVGSWRQNTLLAFMLVEDTLSTCCNKNYVM